MGNKVKLIVVDVLIMELNIIFDVVILNWGVWLFVSCGDCLELVSYIFDVEINY